MSILLAARYFGIPPWEMEHAPNDWIAWGGMCAEVQDEVAPILQERNRLREEALRRGGRG